VKPRTTLTLVIVGMALMGFAPYCARASSAGVLSFYANVALLGCFWVVAVVTHELAHWGVARLLGMDVAAIVVGTGRTIWRTQVADLEVRVGSRPWSGFVLLASAPRSAPIVSLIAVFAAGGVMNLAVAGALSALSTPQSYRSWAIVIDPLGAAVTANAAVAFLSLVPVKAAPFATDGWRILALLFRPKTSVEEIERGTSLVRSLWALRRDAFDEAREMLAPHATKDTEGGRVARDFLALVDLEEAFDEGDIERERAATRVLRGSKTLKQSGLIGRARLDLTVEPLSWERAERLAREGLKVAPKNDAFRLMLGAALAASGRHREACRELEGVDLETPRGKAGRLAFLALANLGLGRRSAAQKLIDRAADVAPNTRYIPAVSAWATRQELGELAPGARDGNTHG
jgi:hypothetical protein